MTGTSLWLPLLAIDSLSSETKGTYTALSAKLWLIKKSFVMVTASA